MNLLDQIDPLPELQGESHRFMRTVENDWLDIPTTRRQQQDMLKKHHKDFGTDWRPHTPGFEINGKGQIRTRDYEPPKPPETDIPIPCVVDTILPADVYQTALSGSPTTQPTPDWVKTLNISSLWPQAEPQTQPASPAPLFSLYGNMPVEGGYYRNVNGARWTCDANGWIPHTPGDPMPCDPEMLGRRGAPAGAAYEQTRVQASSPGAQRKDSLQCLHSQ